MNVIGGQQGQAAWALQALTEGNAACREDFKNSNGVAALTGLLRFPEQWNWTPAVGTLKNVAQGERPMTDALLAEGAVPVLVDLLTFGRPILQVCGLPSLFVACPVDLWPALWVCGLPFIRQQLNDAVKTGCTSPLDAVRQVCGMLSVIKCHVLLDGASCMDACGSDVKTDCTCSFPSSAQLTCSESREVVKHPL